MSRVVTECTHYTIDKNLRLSSDIQDFNPIGLMRARNRAVISQCHMIASQYAINMINDYGLKVIVLERNVLDALASLRDHCNKHPVILRNMMPGLGFFDDNFASLSVEKQFDLLIDWSLRWYILFHISWKRQAAHTKSPPLFCRYEEVYPDISTTFPRIFEFVECNYDKDRLSALDPHTTKSRFNVGQAGRGEVLLTEDQKQQAKSIIASYGKDAEDMIYW